MSNFKEIMKAKLIKDRLFLRKVADSYTLHRIKDNILTIEGDSQYTIGGIDPFYKLSKQNCDEIFGVVDIEQLSINNYPNTIDEFGEETWDSGKLYHRQQGFKDGFNKAMELNRFTLEDIKRAISFGQGMDLWKEEEQIDKFIQSIQQPTEIDVTFNPDEKDSDVCLILKKI